MRQFSINVGPMVNDDTFCNDCNENDEASVLMEIYLSHSMLCHIISLPTTVSYSEDFNTEPFKSRF